MRIEFLHIIRKPLPSLIVLLCLLQNVSVSQQLLNTNWEKTVCANFPKIDYLYSLAVDDSGYVYTLGAFANSGDCLGDIHNDATGSYFLTKQKSDGTKVYSKNFGGIRHFDFGEMRVCKNGDLVLGLSFLDTCFVNGNSIAVNNNYGNAVLLKLNRSFQIKWYEVYRSNNAAYVNALELDSAENIYASVFSHDSLYASTFSSKGTATILKYTPTGSLQWWRNYHTGDTALMIDDICIGKGDFREPCIYLKGKETTSNKVYFGNQLVAQHFNGLNEQIFVSSIDPAGNHFQTKFLGKSFVSVANLYGYNDKMYLAGKFQDSVVCNNSVIKPDSIASLFVATIDKNINLTQFNDLNTNQNIDPKVFIISDSLGYVLTGWYINLLDIQSKTLTTATSAFYYSFLSNFDTNFLLKDLKYVEGGTCRIEQLVNVGSTIYGSSEFDDLCTYSNHTNYAFNEDVSTFKTSDLRKIDWGNITSIPLQNIKSNLEFYIFPNPAETEIRIHHNEEAKLILKIILINTLGQILYSNETSDLSKPIQINTLAKGVYYIKIQEENRESVSYKFVKY